MTILSLHPGLTYICPECGVLLQIDPNKDIYENKYIYCAACRAKCELPLQEAEWRYANDNNNNSAPEW